MRFATLVDNKGDVRDDIRVHMNQLENCQARYRSNTWMGRTRTDSPDEFEPTKIDCIYKFTLKIFCLSKPMGMYVICYAKEYVSYTD